MFAVEKADEQPPRRSRMVSSTAGSLCEDEEARRVGGTPVVNSF